ncbi:PQQ-dependent sugar dehydrogenase [Methylogaea oryzae]|uniref:PQQ-dependent sugar dehydrogenase n=1 Tax=Methylogaea oryzae TaxID=1295382 RepID=UPI001FE35999|nr:sorbosone dehydrogenase family protein [Methylogaea oryzae]
MSAVLGGTTAPDPQTLHRRLRLPEGFVIDTYADGLPQVRLLRFTAGGDLLASLPASGRVVLLEWDENGDGRPDGRSDLLIGLNKPHGLDFRDNWLYVAETDGVARIRYDAAARRVRGTLERVVKDLPADGSHWTRTLKFGPDGWMYVSVGSSCNVCLENDPRRAALLRYKPDSGGGEIYATGLRNTVGFAWRPATQELYGVDNGRDLLGDDFPPCELNRIRQGGFYGWPYANGNRVADPDFGAGHEEEINESIPPVHAFKAHTAPLSIVFLEGRQLPKEYRGAALVALHGSWNRSKKQGYQVVSLHFLADGRIEERPFLSGFEQAEDVIGRPVDVAEGPDGAIYVSDDYAGAIYRVRYAGK